MSRWLRLSRRSLSVLRGVLPVVGRLIAIRPERTQIASSIPGLGDCRSRHCNAERPPASEPR